MSDTNLYVDTCFFIENYAMYSGVTHGGQGGAVLLDFPSRGFTCTLINSNFSNNHADISGGGVQWYVMQPEISDNYYDSNSAYYGNDIASYSYAISYDEFRRRLSKTYYAPGQYIKNPILASILDHYNQTVLTDSSSTAEILISDVSHYSIMGQTKIIAVSGLLNFSDIEIVGFTGTSPTLIINSDFTSAGGGYATLRFNIFLRDCIAGEQLIGNDSCIYCLAGTYNLIPGSICKPCPVGAICGGGDNITAAAGYWRTNNQSDIFFACPNPAACVEELLANSTNNCLVGYKGNLCQSCQLGYSGNSNVCTKCLDSTKGTLLLVGLIVLAIAIVGVITTSNIKGAYKEQAITSIYFKILMNYIQIIMLTISFDLNWPNLVQQMFTTQSKVGGSSDQLFSIDCFLGPNINPYYAKIVLLAVIPVIFASLSIVFWLIWGRLRKSTLLKEKIIGSVIVQLFFFQPSIIKFNFEMFNCREISTGEFYMTQDMSIQCWKSEHLLYSLTVALPSICIWCISVPILLVIVLKKDQDKLLEIEQKLKFGFLYRGYKNRKFFWEFLTLLRKILIISASVFLKNSSVTLQALITFLIILGAYILQSALEPYTETQLNIMEIRSIIVSAVTIYSGLFFLTDTVDNSLGIFFFLLMVFANLAFLGYWTYYTFGFYFGTIYLKLNCCRRIFGKKFNRWVAKVVPESDILALTNANSTTEAKSPTGTEKPNNEVSPKLAFTPN